MFALYIFMHSQYAHHCKMGDWILYLTAAMSSSNFHPSKGYWWNTKEDKSAGKLLTLVLSLPAQN